MPSSPTPRLTVIVPTCNDAEYLERTICSVLDQSYPDLELVIADAGQADRSADLHDLYTVDIHAWINAPQLTTAGRINRAIDQSTGELILFLPSGNLLLPEALQTLAARSLSEPNTDWFVGQGMTINACDELMERLPNQPPNNLNNLLQHNTDTPPISNMAFRRHRIEISGYLTDSLNHAWDFDLVTRLVAQGVQPATLTEEIAAERDRDQMPPIEITLAKGMEIIDVAERFIDELPADQRTNAWRNLDERRMIHTIAQAEANQKTHPTHLWDRLQEKPWWIYDRRFRTALSRTEIPNNDPRDGWRKAA